jgi:hypothetical protein
MKTMRWVTMAVAVAVVSFLVLTSFSAPASAGNTLVVDDDGYGSASDCGASDVAYGTIQAAIDAAGAGDVILVCPGTYNQDEANDRDPDTGGAGSNGFNIFVNKALRIRGINASGTPITNYNDVVAQIVAKRELPTFGQSAIFVQADGVTITGIEITGWSGTDNNKTVEVVGDDVTIQYSKLHALDSAAALYFDDRHFDAEAGTSHVQSYRVEANLIDGGGPDATGIRFSNGAGWSGDVSDRVITHNDFQDNCDAIAFVGPQADPWDAYPVGAATITGNSFKRSDRRHVIAWGRYLGGPGYGDLNWQGIVADNTFDKGAITWTTPGGDARSWDSDPFFNVRGIYSTIQRYAVNKAVAGDIVQVLPGVYNERLSISKSLDLRGAQYGVDPTQAGARTNPANESVVDLTGLPLTNPNVLVEIADGVSNVSVAGFTFVGSPTFHYADEAAVRAWDNYIAIKDNIISGYIDLLYKGPGQNLDVLRNRMTFNKNGVVVQPGTANNVNVSNNALALGSSPGGDEAAIYLTGVTQGTVSGNTAKNVAPNGRGFYGSNLTQLTVSGNTFTGNKDAVSIFGSSTFITLSGNDLSSSLRYGINIKGQDIAISGNEIKNCADSGVFVDKNVGNTERVTISGNNITGNTNYGVKVNTAAVTATVDARNNWWGSGNGPRHATNTFNVGAQGGAVSDGVAFAPWLNAPAPGGASFAPVTTTNPGGSYASIQAGVNASNPGGTVNAASGTFTENVTIAKGVTVAGAGQAATIVIPAVSKANPCAGSSLCGSANAASNIFLVQASNVTIRHLTADGDNPTLTSGIVRGGADLDARNGIVENYYAGVYNNLQVHNVTVKNIYLRGIYASSYGTGFNFHHNTVQNVQGESQSIGIFNFGGSGAISDNSVSDCNDAIGANWSRGTQFLGNTVTNSGSGIHSDNNGGMGGVGDLIQGNTVTNSTAGGYGIWTFVPYLPITVQNNTISGVDVGLAASGQAAPVSTSFVSNQVTGKPGSTGVYVTTDEFGWGSGNVSATFTGNTITGHADGFLIEAQPGYTATVIASGNSIFGNSVSGATTAGDGTHSATMEDNWWGSANGPTHASNTFNVGAQGDIVVGEVDFVPWLDAAPPGGNSFAPVTTTNPFGSHASIQAGVNASNPGGTVNAKAGTYTEIGQIVIGKNLSLAGAKASTTVVKPAGDTGSSGNARGWFLVNSGITFNLSGVTLDGTGRNIYQAIRHLGRGTISDCVFSNIKYPGYMGVGLAAMGPTGMNVDVTDCTFTEIGRIGVIYFGAGVTGTFSGNTYAGKGDGDWLDYAVEVGAGAHATISNSTVSNCLGVALSDGSVSGGVLVSTYYGAGTQASITGNTFTNNYWGIGVGYGATDTSVVVAHLNNISGNTHLGVRSSKPTVDALSNWWGDVTGPYHATKNPAGLGDAVSDYVLFDPWVKGIQYFGDTSIPVGSTARLKARFLNSSGTSPAVAGVTVVLELAASGGGPVSGSPFSAVTDGSGVASVNVPELGIGLYDVTARWNPLVDGDSLTVFGTGDSDGDGVSDSVDNCPTVYNPDQKNSDGGRRPAGLNIPYTTFVSNPSQDKMGDACDPDDDNDSLPDTLEFDGQCPWRLVGDSDGDGVLDGFEVATGYDPCNAASKPTWEGGSDSDADGLLDGVERLGYNTCAFVDDTVPGYTTCTDATDSDGDGCADWIEIHDINGDRRVSGADLLILAKAVSGSLPSTDPVSFDIYDVNQDGRLAGSDLLQIAKNNCLVKPWGGCPVCPAE